MNNSDIIFSIMMTVYSLILVFFIFAIGTEKKCETETGESQQIEVNNDNKKDIVAYARLFCIYKRVFVEFREDDQVWGTIFLNEKGEVVSCTDDKEVNALEAELQ